MTEKIIIAVACLSVGIWVGRWWANRAVLHLIDKSFPKKDVRPPIGYSGSSIGRHRPAPPPPPPGRLIKEGSDIARPVPTADEATLLVEQLTTIVLLHEENYITPLISDLMIKRVRSFLTEHSWESRCKTAEQRLGEACDILGCPRDAEALLDALSRKSALK